MESRVAPHPGECERFFVDVVGTPGAPVEMNVALAVVGAVLENMAEHRFERGEAGAAGDHQEWTRAAAVDELADGPFDAEQGAVCQGGSGGWLAGRRMAAPRIAARRMAGPSK